MKEKQKRGHAPLAEVAPRRDKKKEPKPSENLEGENPNHRADFDRLLEKAVQPVKPKK